MCYWGRCPQCPSNVVVSGAGRGNLETVQEASIHAGSRGLPDLATLEEVWNWLPGALERLYRTRWWGEVGSGRRRKEEKGARKKKKNDHSFGD